MKDQDLLKVLVDNHLLDSKIAAQISNEAQISKKSAENIIYEKGIVDEAEVAKAKSIVLKIPYKKVDLEKITPELLKLITPETARRYSIIPLSKTPDMIVLGVLHPDDLNVQESLRFLGKQQKADVGVYIVTPSDVEEVLKRHSPFGGEVQAAIAAIKPLQRAGERIVKLEPEKMVAEEAPIIKLVSSMVREAVTSNASDLHIEPQQDRLRVRLRIEGELREILSLPLELHKPIVSRIKVLSNLKLDETRVPQDGRFRTMILDREIDFRVATFPTPFGEKAALRVLDPKVGLRSLEDLGLMGKNYDLIKEAISKPYGMVIITGPTGSGKSTTLYAIMQILNDKESNVVSLEDPVEYSISGVNQSQIRPEIGYDFASGLRQILRQDPDIIMVGEIRDSETAQLAVHAALTGHIVLTTLHTNTSIDSIPRLVDLGVQSFLLPSSVNLMAAQRLVSKLCPYCKVKKDPPPEVLEIIRREISQLPAEIKSKYKEPYKIYHSPGCPKCRNKGVLGRWAIFEAFKMTSQLADIINTGVTKSKLLEEARRQEIITLRQDGIIKALEGDVNIDEVLRETEEAWG